jgi:hypothetical protein
MPLGTELRTITSAGVAHCRRRQTLQAAWIRPKHQNQEYGHSPSLARTCDPPGLPPISEIGNSGTGVPVLPPGTCPQARFFFLLVNLYQRILRLTVALAQQQATKKPARSMQRHRNRFSRKLLHFRNWSTSWERPAVVSFRLSSFAKLHTTRPFAHNGEVLWTVGRRSCDSLVLEP